jgi:hypothetical protein
LGNGCGFCSGYALRFDSMINFFVGMHRIFGRPDNPVFFISGIRQNTGFDFPDIRPDRYQILKIVGYPAGYTAKLKR